MTLQPARVRRTQAQRSAQTRAALLDATLDLLATSGYKATTTTAVAHRAGVSMGALLHHFPAKADLIAAAVGHARARRVHEYRQVMAETDFGTGELEDAVDVLWSMYREPMFSVFVELWVAARTEPELVEPLAAMDREFLATCQQIYIERFSDSDISGEVARVGLPMVFSLLTGLAFSNIVPGYDPFKADEVIGAFKTLVRAGLEAQWSAVIQR